jgi:FkbM family methyltransferase
VSTRYTSPRWWGEALKARLNPLIASVGFKPHVISKRLEGVDCQFYLANPTGAAWYGRQKDHRNIELAFARDHMLRPGMRVLEVGGHHGHDLIALSRWVGPTGRVISLEPVPENVAVIRKNIALNTLANAEVIAAAAAAHSGESRINPISNGAIAVDGGVTVASTTIDDLCRAQNFQPDYIKMDIEGFEIDALLGAEETLRRRPALHVELHVHALPKYGRSVADFWDLIDTNAYALWLQDDDLAPPIPIDGPVTPPHRAHVFALPKG